MRQSFWEPRWSCPKANSFLVGRFPVPKKNQWKGWWQGSPMDDISFIGGTSINGLRRWHPLTDEIHWHTFQIKYVHSTLTQTHPVPAQRLLRPEKKGQQMNHKLPHYPIRGKHPVETEPTKPLTAKWFWHVSIGNWAAQWTTHPASIDDMRWHKNTLLQVLLDSSPIKSGDVSIAMVSSSSFIVHPYSSHLPSMQRQLCHLQPAPGCKLWWPPFTLSCPIRNLTKLGR